MVAGLEQQILMLCTHTYVVNNHVRLCIPMLFAMCEVWSGLYGSCATSVVQIARGGCPPDPHVLYARQRGVSLRSVASKCSSKMDQLNYSVCIGWRDLHSLWLQVQVGGESGTGPGESDGEHLHMYTFVAEVCCEAIYTQPLTNGAGCLPHCR